MVFMRIFPTPDRAPLRKLASLAFDGNLPIRLLNFSGPRELVTGYLRSGARWPERTLCNSVVAYHGRKFTAQHALINGHPSP